MKPLYTDGIDGTPSSPVMHHQDMRHPRNLRVDAHRKDKSVVVIVTVSERVLPRRSYRVW